MDERSFPKASAKSLLPLLLWLWLAANPLWPIVENVDFKHLTMDDGLSQNSVYAIVQDRAGFLWFGTENGLNRYDGYGFKILGANRANPAALSGNYINVLLQDRDGHLWVGTDTGLNRIDARTDTITRYGAVPRDPAGLSNKNVKAIVQDRFGLLWLGTSGGGLCRLDPRNGRFRTFKHDARDDRSLSNDVVLALHLDGQGALWVGTAVGLNRLDAGANAFIRYNHDPGNPSSLSHDTVNAILQDSEGFIWIGTAGGLNRLDPRSGKFSVYRHDADDPRSLSHNAVNVLYRDSQGTLWVGTEIGLNAYDRLNNRFRRYTNDPQNPNSLNGDNVRAIFEDKSGTLWVGIWGAGLNKFERENSKFSHIRHNPSSHNSLSNNIVLSFYEESGDVLWIGTFGGLNRWDRKNDRFQAFQNNVRDPTSLSDNRVRAIHKDSRGIYWIGTYGGGLNRFDPRTGRCVRYRNNPQDTRSLSHDQVRSICEDRDGSLWIATDGGGVNRFDKTSGAFKRYLNDPDDPGSFSHNRAFKILADRGGRLWICTFGGGLNRYVPETDSFFQYRNNPDDPRSLPDDSIITIFEDSRGTLWLGSANAGLIQFDPQKAAFITYAEEQGLPSKLIYAIEEDKEGDLWVSHSAGISRFRTKTRTFKNYAAQDGLQGKDYNGNSSYKSPRTGEMFFGGVNGFNSFVPDKIQENRTVPAVVITGFQLFNKPVVPGQAVDGRILLRESIEVTKEIVLSYRDKIINFEFAALNFISPANNKYAFMMEGFDPTWRYVDSRRSATYTALPPGKYTFRVKGSNNDGVWNEEGASLSLRITPPFWRTWWFITLSALLIIGATLSIFGLRVRNLKRIQKRLEHQVALRTQELKEISVKDPLTGLRNRRYLEEVLYDDVDAFIQKKIFQLKKGANRRQENAELIYGILMVDIDFFKTLNDRYGHNMGDRFLVQFSALMRKNIRVDDEVIRFGGEEFLIILKNTQPDYLDVLAQKIRNGINHIEMALENEGFRRSCSIGYAQFPFYSQDPERVDFEKTIHLADLALYYAKRNGRNMSVKIMAHENLPDEGQVTEMISSLEFGLERGFFKILPSA